MNTLDILLLLVLAAVVGLALRSVWRNRRRGGCACSGGCAGCGLDCRRRNEAPEKPKDEEKRRDRPCI